MIIGCIAPFHIGIEAVISGTAFVFLFQPGLRGFLAFAINAHDAVCPELHIGVDKDFQAVCPVAENVIGAAANNDARLLFGKVTDDLILQFPKIVAVGRAEAAVKQGRGEEATGGIFSCFLDVAFVKAAFYGELLNQFGIVWSAAFAGRG